MKQTSIPTRVVPALLFADGLLCILFAIFAHALGIDPSPGWGTSRTMIFLGGLILLATVFFIFKRKPAFSENVKTIVWVGHIWTGIVLVYIWFITFGTFTQWRASTHYYSLLADAFGKGHLYVDVEPGAALLSAADPYNSEGRPPFDDAVWDLSLYKGKLYLYWGPVPALLVLLLQLALKTRILDMVPVFIFLCGLLVVNTLIILKLWRSVFPNLSVSNVTASILVTGLILPILWSLSIPDVYEAAIGAGQFFLMGGIYFALLAFAQNVRKRYLWLAGFFWACSVGSRAINVLPILFLVACSLFWVWKTQPKDWMKLFASLLSPLALGALMIGWYNWARFDSPLEFGIRYQITIYNLNRDMPLAFQADYLPYNILAYIVQPFRFVSGFPFIRPVGLSAQLHSLGMTAPKLYAAGNVTGMLFFAPFLLYSIVPFLKRKDFSASSAPDLLKFVLFLLAGSFLFSIASLLLYYYGQLRFLADVVSQITLLAVIGYWMMAKWVEGRKLYSYISNFLILFTLVASLLLAFTSESGRMEKLNPVLEDKINSIFVEDK